MTHIARKMLLKILRYQKKGKRIIYRLKSILMANLNDRHYKIGNNVRFEVPTHINGKGSVVVGDNVGLGYSLAIKLGKGDILLQARKKDSKIVIGKNSYLSNNVSIIACKIVEIGENCLIGDGVTIYDSDFHDINPATRHIGKGLCKTVRIKNNVWVGSRVLIQKGVCVGENTVIASMSVVTKDIPDNSIAAGIPAKVVDNI